MIRSIAFLLAVFLFFHYSEGSSEIWSEIEARAEVVESNPVEARAEMMIAGNPVEARAEVIASNPVKEGAEVAAELNSGDWSSEEDHRRPCHWKSNTRVSCTGGEGCVDQLGRHCYKKHKQLKWWIVLIICISVVVGVLLLAVISIKHGSCCRQTNPSVHVEEPVPEKVNNSYDHTPPGTPLSQSQIWTTGKVNSLENPSVPEPPAYVEKAPEYIA